MRIALAQLNSTPEIEANLETCSRLAADAASGGASFLLYPENAPFLGKDVEKAPIAESENGKMVGAFRDLASKHGIWISLGSYPERIEGSEKKTYNTHLLIDSAGEIAARYRKIHLFDVEIEGGIELLESEGVEAGEEVVVADLPVGSRTAGIGLSVCYDLRFPELYREQAARGAQILTVPSAFTLQTGRDHWHPLLRARAIENQCWVLAAGQWGHHFGKRWSYGHSCAYDPWGQMVACASDGVGLTYTELDLERVDDIRRRMPCLEHRRM